MTQLVQQQQQQQQQDFLILRLLSVAELLTGSQQGFLCRHLAGFGWKTEGEAGGGAVSRKRPDALGGVLNESVP